MKLSPPLPLPRPLVRYIDDLGDGNGEIDLPELEAAFRRGRRARAAGALEEVGRRLIGRLADLIADLFGPPEGVTPTAKQAARARREWCARACARASPRQTRVTALPS